MLHLEGEICSPAGIVPSQPRTRSVGDVLRLAISPAVIERLDGRFGLFPLGVRDEHDVFSAGSVGQC